MTGGERDLLLDAFDSNWIAPLGPHVDLFEQEFAQTVEMPHAVALSSGTAALHLAMLIQGVQPGDEVLTATLTFVATANAITYCGAKPVFIDSERKTWNLDPNLLEEEIKRLQKVNQLPKAVVAVDVYGQCADYDSIVEICKRFEVPLIEDAAEALGARYQHKTAGSFGEAACFSFNGNKIITTSGGGMLVTKDKAFAERARFLATQARDQAPHYQHSNVGFNYRLSNLLAAVGRGQLQTLPEKVEKRRQVFSYYEKELGSLDGISLMPEPEECTSTRWLTVILIDPKEFGATTNDVRIALESKNIESRPLWKPMHLQPLFENNRSVLTGVCDQLFEQGLCLPSGSGLTTAELELIVSIIKSCYKSK